MVVVGVAAGAAVDYATTIYYSPQTLKNWIFCYILVLNQIIHNYFLVFLLLLTVWGEITCFAVVFATLIVVMIMIKIL